MNGASVLLWQGSYAVQTKVPVTGHLHWHRGPGKDHFCDCEWPSRRHIAPFLARVWPETVTSNTRPQRGWAEVVLLRRVITARNKTNFGHFEENRWQIIVFTSRDFSLNALNGSCFQHIFHFKHYIFLFILKNLSFLLRGWFRLWTY